MCGPNHDERQEVAVASVTKAELLDKVASSAGVTKVQAESVLNSFFDTVRTSAKKGDKVAWPGFGSFSSSKRAARTGRNPRTGAPVKIPASTSMKFTSSSTLKDFFKGGGTAKKAAAKKTTAKKTAKKTTKKR
jgi:DNA-binding protein HU-beta